MAARKATIWAAGIVAALALSGCGSDGEITLPSALPSGSIELPTNTRSAEPTEEPTEQLTEEPTDATREPTPSSGRRSGSRRRCSARTIRASRGCSTTWGRRSDGCRDTARRSIRTEPR